MPQAGPLRSDRPCSLPVAFLVTFLQQAQIMLPISCPRSCSQGVVDADRIFEILHSNVRKVEHAGG